jgi:tripartite-type tricarboxylate transporter receptor subunit TctC
MKVTAPVAIVAIALASVAAAHAQNFPSKPVTIVVGFPPGGPTDSVARIMAERMKTTFGETVIVENQAGAAGTIAAARVARAPADGYTLSVGQWTTNVGAPRMFPVKYHVLDDFAPVALLTSSKLWIIARKDLPAKDMKEMVAWLKANPGKANAASVGVGSAAHVCLVDMANKSGAKFQIVTYRGGAPAMQDLLGGQADFGCLEAGQTLGHHRGGKLRAMGVASDSRWFGAPEVPTLAEGGLPGVALEFWHGLWAPKGTPKDVVDKLNSAVIEAFGDAAVQKRFRDLGHTLPANDKRTPEALHAHHKAELDKWWPIMEAAGIKGK